MALATSAWYCLRLSVLPGLDVLSEASPEGVLESWLLCCCCIGIGSDSDSDSGIGMSMSIRIGIGIGNWIDENMLLHVAFGTWQHDTQTDRRLLDLPLCFGKQLGVVGFLFLLFLSLPRFLLSHRIVRTAKPKAAN